MKTLKRSTILLLLIVLFCFVGCATHSHTVIKSDFAPLRDRGIQVLSTSNPYHGPNLILSRAIEMSPNLAGYFEHNGAPTAIEVRSKTLKNDELLLYYPNDYQVYVARHVRRHSPHGEWIIDGPYRIGRRDYRMLRSHLERSDNAQPTFKVFGASLRYTGKQQMASNQTMRIEPDVPLIPKPRPKPKKVIKKEPKKEKAEEAEANAKAAKSASGKLMARIPELDDPSFIPTNADQKALALSKGYAKRAPNGDILHAIEGGAQSLKNIAHWYMGSVEMFAELQEANRFREDQLSAKKGTILRIPLEFIRNTKQMPINHRAPKKSPLTEKEMKERNKIGAEAKKKAAEKEEEAKT